MNKKLGRACSNASYVLFVVGGALWPLICGDRKCNERLGKTARTLLISTAVVQILKLIVPEWRPDTGRKGSFPSGHSTNTMAVATLGALQNPAQAAAWYMPAVGISLSRIALRRHHVRDVVVGSILGLAVAGGIALHKSR